MKSNKEKIWREVKKRYRLSNEMIAMAKKFGGLGNHKQEPWKERFDVDVFE